MSSIHLVLDLLTSRERRGLYLLFVAVLIMAALQVVSVASIMPFLSVASNPEAIQENDYLFWVYNTLGYTNQYTFLATLGLSAFAALLLSNCFIMLVTWAQAKYVWNRNHSISLSLLENYLWQPYEYFLTRNSADLSKNILEETREVTTKLLLPAIQGSAKGIVALSIIGFLVYVDPAIATVIALVLGGAYLGIWLLVRGKLEEIGEKRVKVNRGRYQSVTESFGGIKEVKLRGKEGMFVDRFREPSKLYASYRALHLVINRLPRYALEAVAFGGIVLIAVYMIVVRSNIQQVIPMLGLYAFAGYRLMPALHGAFKGFARAQFNKAALETLHRDMHEGLEDENKQLDRRDRDSNVVRQEAMTLDDHLKFDDVTYSYPEAHEPAIENLSVRVNAQSTVGFVGKTGSGKTTAVDLMLGLLRPQEGSVLVDGVPLGSKNLQSWRSTLGYVPQDIYLVDATIAQNIAFGVPTDQIDYDRIEKVIQQAQIHDFILEELPNGLETMVGERGVKLSGGQQQRIGIARALYHRPSVVVFDEATSALDQSTEQAVMDAVYNLGKTRTIVLISHRLSSVQNADRIFMLEDGKKIGQGTYEKLEQQNSKFRSMALS